MPFDSEAQTSTAVKARTTAPDPFERAALSGTSPLEAGMLKPASVKEESEEKVDVGPIDTSTLKQAQAKDLAAKTGKQSPSEPEKETPAETSATKPDGKASVPDLPVQEEWRPKGEKAGKQWDELKAKHNAEAAALKAEVDRMKSELAAAKAVGDVEEVKSLRQQLKQYQEVIRDVAIERDPGFKQKFEPREKTAIEAAKLAAGDQGPKLETLLKSPPSPWRDEQIQAITSELSESSQRRIDSALRMLDQIDLEKQSEIATQRANFQQKQMMTESQQREFQEKRLQEFTGAFESTLKKWTDPESGHPFLTERKGDAEFNKAVSESRTLATNLHQAFLNGELAPEDIAKAMLHVAVADRTLKTAMEAVKRAEKAERALAKIMEATPGDGRNGEPDSDEVVAGPSPGSPGYMKWLNTELKARQERDLAVRRGQ